MKALLQQTFHFSFKLFVLTITFGLFTLPRVMWAQEPVAWYPFEGNAEDASTYGNHGTVHGASLAEDRFGNANSAYFFDGNEWIDAPHAQQLVFGADDDFTIMAWVRIAERQPDYAGIVAKGPSGTYSPGIFLVIFDGYYFRTAVSTPKNTYIDVQDEMALNDCGWHFVTTVVETLSNNQRVLRAYVDGELIGETIAPAIDPNDPPSQNPLMFGRERNQKQYLTGWLDDIRIFDRALSQAEVMDFYTEGDWPNNAPEYNTPPSIQTSGSLNSCLGTNMRLSIYHECYNLYEWSTGETTNEIEVTEPGVYSVKMRTCETCPEVTKIITVEDAAPTGRFHASISQDLTATYCDEVIVPVEVKEVPDGLQMQWVWANIYYDDMPVRPLDVTPDDIRKRLPGTLMEGWEPEVVEDRDNVLRIRFGAPQSKRFNRVGTLCTVRFETELPEGMSEENQQPTLWGIPVTVAVDDVLGCIDLTTSPGRIILLPCTTTDVPEIREAGEGMMIRNVPNPFAERTEIQYVLKEAGPVKLEVLNPLGELVAMLDDAVRQPGEYSAEWDARAYPAGTYYFRLINREGTVIRSMIVLR